MTDPQTAAIVVAANSVDIEAGKLAQSKTRNEKVKQFADTMVNDHTAVNKSAVELVTSAGRHGAATDRDGRRRFPAGAVERRGRHKGDVGQQGQ